ncbi:MAG TPA: dihydrolipoyl dehydrogenase [Phycisphaeraceae bacterium]
MKEHDLIVIGGGPGGYVAAIRAAQLGLNVACVEKAKELGGTCLRVGCIPSKALLESSERFEEVQHHLAAHGIRAKQVELDLAKMLDRKSQIVQTLARGVEGLFKKNKVTRYQGQARFNADRSISVQTEGGEQQLRAPHIIIATGSKPASIPGVDLNADRVDTSTEALSYEQPPKRLAVIGAGYIGIEIGSVWRRLGSQVTILEYLDRILPGMDSEIASEAHRIFQKQGLEFRLKSKVTGVKKARSGVTIQLEGAEPVQADRVLVAVGRVPNTDGLGLKEIGVELDERGRIRVNGGFRTNVEGVYAIGDVIAGPMLAHKAQEEGVACVEKIVTGTGHVNYDAIPAVVYTHPEIASVGRTEDELKAAGVEYRKGVFPFAAVGRARALEQTQGRVKILADARTDRVLGAHIIGPRAGDLIAECVAAIEFGASAEDLARISHAHPTLAEAVKEAALDAQGRVIHM